MASTVPFVVPVFVQVFSRTSMAYTNRYLELLLKLLMEREDPALVMDINGEVLTAGNKILRGYFIFKVIYQIGTLFRKFSCHLHA